MNNSNQQFHINIGKSSNNKGVCMPVQDHGKSHFGGKIKQLTMP
jgi:hypothetical protein